MTGTELKAKMMEQYADFEDTFGIGPCGNMAHLLREKGYGEIEVCIFMPEDATRPEHGFPHFYIRMFDGEILDVTNPFRGKYTEIERLDSDEEPDLVDDETVDWLRARVYQGD